MPAIDLSILNQRQTPAFYADVFANRPAAGFVGRIFVSTNTFAFYRDNGTGWDLIGGPGTGTITGSGAAGQVSFWNGASTITGENNLWWDSANNHLGINTNTPATALDVNHNGTLIAKFNNTTSANSLVAFENAGNEQWWIGTENTNNDFLFYDATNFPTLSLRTTFKTSGQVLIGGGSTGSGKLVVESATSDNGIQIVGANAPSLRIDSAATGPTKRIGLGISTGVNNFIQGSVDRDMCIFNGSTTASPMLFGIYGTTNVQEAARISAARNFLIGTTTDAGYKLDVAGTFHAGTTNDLYFDGAGLGIGTLTPVRKLTVNNGAIGIFNNSTGITSTDGFVFSVNGTDALITNFENSNLIFQNNNAECLRFNSSGTATFTNLIYSPGYYSFATGGGQVIMADQDSRSAVLRAPGATFGFLGQVGTSTNHDFSIIQNNISAIYIPTTRNVLIGTTTDAGQKLQVNGNATFKNNLRVNTSAVISVSTSATTISSASNTYGGLAMVWGADSGGNIFSDFLYYSLGTFAVLASQNVSGGPAGRTYSTSGSGDLRLTMGSGTYDVRYQALLTT